ncbi:hypothetical protein KP509_32G044900 [Ceratopteris richardii]|nr:hypothetical protein KP509_32G044900 [Ceratopteris richardii]
MQEGKSIADHLRREEVASKRRIVAEAKRKRQERDLRRRNEKASVKPEKHTQPFIEEQESKDNKNSVNNDGFLDDSIVQYLSQRERVTSDEKMVSSQPKKLPKVKRAKSIKGQINDRVQVVDLNQDSLFMERSALEFKNGHLYGNRIKRDPSMLRVLARATNL